MHIIKFHIAAGVFLLFAGTSLFQSCSLLKKNRADSTTGGPAATTAVTSTESGEQKKQSPEKIKDDLMAIANSSASMLPPSASDAPEKKYSPEKKKSPAPSTSPETAVPGATPESPGMPDLDPHRVHIGDIFIGKEGLPLKKIASFSDALHRTAPQVEVSLLQSVTTIRPATVPLTISQGELAKLKKKVKPGTSLPTRSVALDFKSSIHQADLKKLEELLWELATGKVDQLSGNKEISALLKSRMTEIKKQLSSGETIYVITKLTKSASALASYPGAPIGKRDVKRIRTAVMTMFPQFDSLEAQKEGDKVLLSRPDGMTWTFEANRLKNKAARFRIDPAQAHTF